MSKVDELIKLEKESYFYAHTSSTFKICELRGGILLDDSPVLTRDEIPAFLKWLSDMYDEPKTEITAPEPMGIGHPESYSLS